jgi:hypothetical protein
MVRLRGLTINVKRIARPVAHIGKADEPFADVKSGYSCHGQSSVNLPVAQVPSGDAVPPPRRLFVQFVSLND